MGKETRVKGRLWVLTDPNGELYEDIDTDMIFHNRYLHITDVDEMGQYSLDNLEGWEDFADKAQPGDIVMAGKNFGAGSSRQQAVDCFASLGVSAIVGRSFGAIYERNAINAGMPVLRCDWSENAVSDGDELTIDLAQGTIENTTQGKVLSSRPLSAVQLRIYERGGLLARERE